ncbi:MAG TPA: hypothetical protein VFI23_18945 [Rhizomicrobium sp.]|nr:hypothetical protein [Rhizomicrobium sp.]
MRVTGPLEPTISRGSRALVAAPRRCEKPSASSALNGYRREEDQAGQSPAFPLRIELVSQEGTRGFDPFWDGPRLLPAFVAQVMAQAMAMPERRLAAAALETAYASLACPRMALVLDRKS